MRADSNPQAGERRASQQGLKTQVKAVGAINAAGNQAFIGAGNGLGVIQLGFVQGFAGAVVNQQAFRLFDALNDQADALADHLLANAELGTRNRRAVGGIATQHARGGKKHLHIAPFQPNHGAEAKLGFGVGNEALSGDQCHRCSTGNCRGGDYPPFGPGHKLELPSYLNSSGTQNAQERQSSRSFRDSRSRPGI